MHRRILVPFIVAIVLVALPAAAEDVTGEWEFSVELDMGSGSPTFVFEQDGEKLTGTYRGIAGEAEVEGTVEGNEVRFSFESSFGTVTYQGTIQEDGTMKGTADYGGQASGTWTAGRTD
jgi:hypothetical protein